MTLSPEQPWVGAKAVTLLTPSSEFRSDYRSPHPFTRWSGHYPGAHVWTQSYLGCCTMTLSTHGFAWL